MKWKIEPGISIGPVEIGMSAAEAADEIGSAFTKFKRTPVAPETVYAFDKMHIHVTCGDDDGKVRTISAFAPSELYLDGIQLLGRQANELLIDLSSNKMPFEREDAGYWLPRAGVLLVAVNDKVDGVEIYPLDA